MRIEPETIHLLLRRHLQLALLAAAALFILAFALASGLFWKNTPVDDMQAINWFSNYSLGYNNRALLGSIFQLFHGAPSLAVVRKVVPVWDYYLLALLIAAAWALLVPRILLLPVSAARKWLLLSLAAVLLLAPVWRANAIHIGFMDKWMLLAAFAALAALIANRPWLYAALACAAIPIHSAMPFYTLLFLLLIAHAAVYVPRTRRHWRAWLAAAALPLCLALLLYLINDPQHIVDLARKYHFTVNGEIPIGVYESFTSPIAGHGIWKAQWLMFPRNFWLGILIFGGAPVALALAAAVCLKKAGGNAPQRLAAAARLARRPALAAAARFIDRRHLLIVLLLASIFCLPIHIFAVDWSRFFYWGWWGVLIAFSYLLHAMPPAAASKEQRAKSKEWKENTLAGAAAAFFFALAYLYGGAPLNVSHINRPWVFPCKQLCIPYLTVNPLGRTYSLRVHSLLTASLVPIESSARNALFASALHGPLKLQDEDGASVAVPAGYEGNILAISFTAQVDKIYTVTANHEAESAPALHLRIDGAEIKATRRSPAQTQWRFATDRHSLPQLRIHHAGGAPFVFVDFSVESEDAPPPQ